MKKQLDIPIQKLDHYPKHLVLPYYATKYSAGVDLYAAITDQHILQTGKRILIATGIAIALPIGYEAQVRPRSGIAWDYGVTVLNSPGTIDCDYRGEIKVMIIHLGENRFTITPGMRIAQLVISPIIQANWIEAINLNETKRGAKGFGSTGKT